MKTKPNTYIQVDLDEHLAKTLRGLSVIDADVSIKFTPKLFVTAEAPKFNLEFFGSDDSEYYYEYDDLTDEMVRVDKELDEYERDKFVLRYPVSNLAREFSVPLDLRKREYLIAGNSLIFHGEYPPIWLVAKNPENPEFTKGRSEIADSEYLSL